MLASPWYDSGIDWKAAHGSIYVKDVSVNDFIISAPFYTSSYSILF
jgi:hypothetical protein